MLRRDGRDRPVRTAIYRLEEGGATPFSSPQYRLQRTRWARMGAGGTRTVTRETTVGGIAQHETVVTFRFHDQVDVRVDDIIVAAGTTHRVTGIGDPRTYSPDKLRSVEAVVADKDVYTLVSGTE